MSDRTLATYSLVRALYEQGKDYIDAFWPFLLRVLPPDKRLSPINTIADDVSREFGLSVPLHTAKTLLERARRKHHYVRRERGCYALTNEGAAYLQNSETPREVARRLQALVRAAAEFLGETNAELGDPKRVEPIIRDVIDRNFLLFDYTAERPAFRTKSGEEAEYHQAVLEFFAHVEHSDPPNFATLRDLVLGSTIAGLLRRTDISEALRQFEDTRFYLDANFALSVAGLRYAIECRPAEELLRLINRTYSISLHIYDFTLHEIIGVLRGYAKEGRKYPAGVKINSIYAAMRAAGHTPATVTELIADLPELLAALGVQEVKTGIKLKDLDEPDAEVLSTLRRYKPEQDLPGQLHDLTAIDLVARERRRADYRRAEEPEAYLLTEDYRLSNYAYAERGHRESGTMSEVMPDRLLTNLLWLKEPEMLEELSVEAAIALHSRDLFIERQVWQQFYSVIDSLLQEGRVDEDAAMLLLYDSQVQRDLAVIGTPGAEDVDRAWALDRLEGARDRRNDQKEWEAAQARNEMVVAHETELAEVIATREREKGELSSHLDRLERRLALSELNEGRSKSKWQALQKTKAQKDARRIMMALKSAALLALAAFGYWAGEEIVTLWDRWEGYQGLVALVLFVVLGILGWRLDPLDLHKKLNHSLAEWRLTRRLEDADLIFSGRSAEDQIGSTGSSGERPTSEHSP